MFDIQTFVQTRIGWGKYQYFSILSLIIVEITDGIQVITSKFRKYLVSLITPLLQKQMKMNQKQISLITSLFYIGVAIGSMIFGILSNKIGRKPSLLIGSIFQITSGFFLSFKRNIVYLGFFRFFYGVGFGSTLAISTIIATQLLSLKKRGKGLLIISFMNSIGKIIGVLLAMCFKHKNDIDWQKYMFTSSIINILGFILVFLFISQSYRYLLLNHKFNQSFIIINQIIHTNDPQAQPLNNLEEKSLAQWASNIYTQQIIKQSAFKKIFYQKRKIISLGLGWFSISFIFYAQMYIVPFLIKQQQNGLNKYFIMTLGQLPSLFLTYNLIQRKYFGRKNSLVIFFIFNSVFCLIAGLHLSNYILFLTKMMMKAIFQMIYPFTSQSFQTKIRSVAFSLCTVIGRIGAIIMPFIIDIFGNKNNKDTFFILSICSIIGCLSILIVQKDTTNIPLDTSFEYKDNQMQQSKHDNKVFDTIEYHD